jgi:hypothetical protein
MWRKTSQISLKPSFHYHHHQSFQQKSFSLNDVEFIRELLFESLRLKPLLLFTHKRKLKKPMEVKMPCDKINHFRLSPEHLIEIHSFRVLLFWSIRIFQHNLFFLREAFIRRLCYARPNSVLSLKQLFQSNKHHS